VNAAFGPKEMSYIVSALARGKGTWVLAAAPSEVGLHNVAAIACGAPQAISIKGGVIVMLGLTRESLTTLRDLADELLKGAPAS
jgi:hypothetical protein